MKKYFCPECGNEIFFHENSECYECEQCGFFEHWEELENGVRTAIGIPLEYVYFENMD